MFRVGMDLTVDLELNEVIRQIDRYIHGLGMDGPTVVKDQTRLLLKQLMDDATPPDSLAQGRTAIAGDLRKIFFPFNNRNWRLVIDRKGAFRIFPIAHKRNRRGASVTDELTALPFSAMKAWHYGRLNSRGRVKGTTPGNLVGRKKSDVAKMGLVKLSDFRKYRASVQKRVGKAKAGFVPGYQAVGGTGVKSWVARHNGADGSVPDKHLDPGELDPRITIINATRGARGIRADVLARSLSYRAAAMKTHISKLLSLRAKEAGLA